MDGTARVLAFAGIAVGFAGVLLAVTARGGFDEAREEARKARDEAAAATAAATEVKEQAATTAEARRARAEGSDALAARVAALEAAAARGPAGGGGAAAPATAETAPGAGSSSGTAPDPALFAEYDALRRKFFGGTATAEETARLFEVLKAPGFLERLLSDLEGKVANAPGDHDGRMNLADAYIAKLFTVPPGPEMGVWGMKAEDQWKEILKQDDRHWRARFNLAFSWSQYPEFLNKTPDSIREFEKLRGQQEQGAADPRHADTYFHLHSLYRRMGNAERAKEALEEGLRRFPEDPELKKVQESAGK